jgi:hypothetical protein
MGTHRDPPRARQRFRPLLRVLGFGTALIVGPAILAPGVADARDAQPGPRVREDLVVKLVGKKVRIDPATQRPRAINIEEARELVIQLVAMTSGPSEPAAEVQRPDGSAMLSLAGHAGHVLVGRPNDDGTTSIRCVRSADEAVDFLTEEGLPDR